MGEKKSFLELIKVKKDVCGSGDFNGEESSLSVTEQVDYLKEFGSAYAEQVGYNPTKKIVSEKEIAQIKRKFVFESNSFRNKVNFDKAEFYLSDKRQYKYLFTYTPKAQVDGDSIVMKTKNVAPLPAFDIETPKSITRAEIKFNIKDGYQVSTRGRIDTMTAGKVIELRYGIEEVVKIGLYTSGEVFVRLNYPDKYHHQNIALGQFAFDTENCLSVRVEEKRFFARLNDGEEIEFEKKTESLPDTLFVGYGMQAWGDWTVTPVIYTTDDKKLDIFALNDEEEKVEYLGERILPFCVGTYGNRRKTLIMKKSFDYTPTQKQVRLYFSTVDPCGKASLNGETLFDDDNFFSHSVEVCKYIKEKDNQLIVEVEPRAPENLITWHRCNDPYFGWYVGNIYVESVGDSCIERVYLKTTSVSPKITFDTTINVTPYSNATKAEVFVIKNGREIKVGEGAGVIPCVFNGTPWSVDTPKLYTVKIKLYCSDTLVDEYEEITGFRIIEQKKGAIQLNGKDFLLKGALIMQYLPPISEIPINHVCPSIEQIIWQVLMAKKMNCNVIRMHQLGYGTNDSRFARICDYLGMTVIWTTRLPDDIYTTLKDGEWKNKNHYQRQMLEVINSPSIIVWEGGNELYLNRKDIDNIYREFVMSVKAIDDTRLLNPVSHLYYANDSYNVGCEYYQENGRQDEYFRKCKADISWKDSLVIRSAHPYIWLLGYGTGWQRLRGQSWSALPMLLNSRKHAYVVTEYAIAGRQNPNIEEAKEFFNPWSYEFADEKVLGYQFDDTDNGWFLSQSYQALAAKYTTKQLLVMGVDGMIWCALQGGANNGGYLKPPIDFYGYPKLAYYALQETFEGEFCGSADTDIVYGKSKIITPVVVCPQDRKKRKVKVTIMSENGETVFEKCYNGICLRKRITTLEPFEVNFSQDGYYKIIYEVEKC